MNFATTTLEDANGKMKFSLGDQELVVGDELFDTRPALRNYGGREVIVGIRPQDFEDSSVLSSPPEGCRVKAQLDLVEAIGTETLLHFKINAPVAVTEEMKELAADVGGEAAEQLERRAKEGVNEFVAQVDPKSRLREGQTADLVVDTSRLHFFDPETADSIFD